MQVFVPAGGDESIHEWLRTVSLALAGSLEAGVIDFSAADGLAESTLLFTHSFEDPSLRLLQELDSGVLFHICDDETLSLSLSYEKGRFSDEFAQTILSCVESIAVQLPHAQLEAVRTLDLIPSTLRAQYLAPPQGSPVNADGFQRLVHKLIEDQTRREPARIAGIENGTTITYADLESRANQLARRLMRMGAGPGPGCCCPSWAFH